MKTNINNLQGNSVEGDSPFPRHFRPYIPVNIRKREIYLADLYDWGMGKRKYYNVSEDYMHRGIPHRPHFPQQIF